jgi:hypothetical protein
MTCLYAMRVTRYSSVIRERRVHMSFPLSVVVESERWVEGGHSRRSAAHAFSSHTIANVGATMAEQSLLPEDGPRETLTRESHAGSSLEKKGFLVRFLDAPAPFYGLVRQPESVNRRKICCYCQHIIPS